ncbi:hypothetical protein JNUCC1_02415 [Lentibacillus sp. JNUCC-1]|uniref:hypothetical protein n=1 Tax=Lentibacillus sp. JNUCC-1 TaxID=2654513 RepID=UPI0012E7395F|nr:hypothetical protein [Lentibacillus sp. JNUCC-1]MUV38561.1 hypothetical protein [Lentibacillus sp. JNUCC-1]
MSKTNHPNHRRALGMLLWSIALPGFGQLLNQKYIKGIILIAFEIAVNVMGNLNQVIILSFHGEIQEAIELTNYNWLMFYPCLYFFAMWDAYHDGRGGKSKFAYLPFVASAYIVTVGLIFSPVLSIGGVKFGPVWLSILFMPIGLGVGAFVRWILLKSDV